MSDGSGTATYQDDIDPDNDWLSRAADLESDDRPSEARAIYEELAQSGNVQAMTRLGVLILKMPATDADIVGQATIAAGWLDKAARRDDPEAMTYLAGLLQAGMGAPYDLPSSIALLERAVALDYAPAMTFLGRGYLYGQWGVEQAPTEAVLLFRRAADAGDAEAMALMGLCYQLGAGVQQDLVEAVDWLQSAADGGSINGMAGLGDAYFNGRGVQQDYAQAAQWLAAAGPSHGLAQNTLGLCYAEGFGVPQDPARALACFVRAAELGNVQGMANAARAYYNGFGTPVDYDQAFVWQRLAAEGGNVGAQSMLGTMHYLGQGTPVDYDQAFIWSQRAATAGEPTAMGNLGFLYKNGHGAPVNYNEALIWYLKAAQQGNTMAMLELGQMYGQGIGVPVDREQAIAWYEQAARAGNPKAQEFLRSLGAGR